MVSCASLHCCYFLLHKPYFSITSLYKFHSTLQPSSLKFQSPNLSVAFPIFALKKRGNGATSISEFSDSDDEFLDEDGGEKDEEMLLPLQKVKEWLNRRPRGFGEGKEYDTLIEDQLLEEMELSRAAQASNLNKLKNDSSNLNSYTKVAEIEAPEIVNAGVCVRIVNLPKKKNIHRDLMMSFKEFPGITKITPAVSGNKKTRDPICKGFAFVDFKSEADAIRFTQAFSSHLLTFGKIQKQIKCEILRRPSFSSQTSVGKMNDVLQLIIPEEEDQQVANLDMNDYSERQEETSFDNSPYLANGIIRTTVDIEEKPASINELHSDGDGEISKTESKIHPRSLKEQEKIQELGKVHSLEKKLSSKEREELPKEVLPVKGKRISKKKQSEEKGGKKLSIEIPGSAKRLKVKEKAVLADVYTRYGIK